MKHPIGRKHSHDPADDGHQDALYHHLSHQSAAACADRRSNRHLASPTQRASEQQVGHVDAPDQQQRADGRPHERQTAPHASRDLILERNKVRL